MAESKKLLMAFNAGELSPKLRGRSDLKHYSSGAATMENMLPLAQGGAERRPGTQFCAEAADSSKAVRLIPFVYSTTQSYVLEFGDKTVRFFTSGGGQVQNGGSAYEIVSPYAAADLDDIRYIQSADVLYLVHPNYKPRTLSRNAHTDWVFAEMTVASGPWLDENISDTTLTINIDDYAAGTTYATGALVVHDGTVYESLRDSNTGNTPDTSSSYWQKKNSLEGLTVDVTASAAAFEAGDSAGALYLLKHVRNDAMIEGAFATDAPVWVDPEKYGPVTYARDDVVTLDGILFTCIQTHTATSWYFVPPNPDLWEVGSDGGESHTFRVGRGRTWRLTTHGSWDGVLSMYRSFDSGVNWETYKSWSSKADKNVIESEQEDKNCQVKLIMTARDSGTCSWVLQVEDQYYDETIVRLSTVASTTGATAEVVSSEANFAHLNSSTEIWAEGAWSDRRGWPSVIGLHRGRLWLAATEYQPETVWGSRVDEWEQFDLGVLDDDAIQITLASSQRNGIQWLGTHQGLLAGTEGEEWYVGATRTRDPITPTDFRAHRQSTYGTSRATTLNDCVLALDRHGKRLYEFKYDYNADGFVAADLMVLAEHLTERYTISEMAWQGQPWNCLWGLRSDGTLLSFTYMREHEVTGWARHTTQGTFESVAVIPGAAGDEVYVVANRTVDGATVRYVEAIIPAYWSGLDDFVGMDSSLAIDPTGVSGTGTLRSVEHGPLWDSTSTFRTKLSTDSAHGLTGVVLLNYNNEKLTVFAPSAAEYNDLFWVMPSGKTGYSVTDATDPNDGPFGNVQVDCDMWVGSGTGTTQLKIKVPNMSSVMGYEDQLYYLEGAEGMTQLSDGVYYLKHVATDWWWVFLIDSDITDLASWDAYTGGATVYPILNEDHGTVYNTAWEQLHMQVTAAHLANEECAVLADDGVYTLTADGSGVIDFGDGIGYANVRAGLPFSSTLSTLPVAPEAAPADRTVRVSQAVIRRYRSSGGAVKVNGGTAENLHHGSSTQSPVTEMSRHVLRGELSDEAYIAVVQDDPLPMTVLSILFALEVF